MAYVVSDALVANRGSTFCFVMAIVCTNAVLLYKYWRKNNDFVYNAKHLTLISLAIGDIFLPAFYLIMNATLLFEADVFEDIACTSQHFLLPIVYGIGLFVLALEVAIRQRATTSSSSSGHQGHDLAKAFIFSAVPWFAGLVMILPLTMAGLDWDYAFCSFAMTFSRQRAMYGVSIILPAVLAFVSPQHQPAQAMILAPVAPATVISTSESCWIPVSSTNPYQLPQHGPPQNGPPQYHNAAYYHLSQPYAYQGDGYKTAPGYLPQPQPVNSATSATDPREEENTLLHAAEMFCFCVLPYVPVWVLEECEPDS